MPRTDDENRLGQQFLYPLNDPAMAFSSALREMGINPNRSNPFVAQLQKSATGARNAFLSRASRDDEGIRTDAYADPSKAYASWLKNQIGGGSLMGAMTNIAGEMPQSIDAVRRYEAQLAGGNQDATQVNPYMAALRDIYASDNGRGALAAYGSMRTPRLGSLGQSYTRALSDVGDTALYNYGQRGTMNDDVWSYIFKGGVF